MGTWLSRPRLNFLAVAEHRLIPAWVCSEWARPWGKGLASVHVGNAGVGVVSMKGALVALPTFATAQFRRFIDCNRAIRRLLPFGFGRFIYLVVFSGNQGADSDAEQLALTDQLFDAASGELGVVARFQPSLIVGDFNVEPTKIPCLAEGISAGLTWTLPGRWLGNSAYCYLKAYLGFYWWPSEGFYVWFYSCCCSGFFPLGSTC